jgi:hypothetical protein
MRVLSYLLPALLAVAPPWPPPAAAQSTAAWVAAMTYCNARRAGLTLDEAVRVSFQEIRFAWSDEMRDPTFSRLMLAEIRRYCPGY